MAVIYKYAYTVDDLFFRGVLISNMTDDDDDDENMEELWPITCGRNPMRHSTMYPNTIELLVQSPMHGKHIVFFDDWRMDEVKDYRWGVIKNGNGFYVITNCRPCNGKHTTMRMHVLLFPDLAERARDHINRDPRNNREENLRCGDHGVNERNITLRADNTSGTTGVRRIGEGIYRAAITERGGRRKQETFSAHNYGSDEEALRQAAVWRREQAARALEDCIINGGESIPEHNGKRKRYRKKRNNTTGVRGISHRAEKKNYVASWYENKKQKFKAFSYVTSGDREGAFAAACAHRKEMTRGKYNDE